MRGRGCKKLGGGVVERRGGRGVYRPIPTRRFMATPTVFLSDC